jgi:NAD(P)-dependent dehydrogenase (short-subunit alcohol dehydrogenase family)
MAGVGRLSGSTAIVIGVSEGIGEVITKTVAREGASVAVVSRKLTRTQRVSAEMVASGGTALALQADETRFQDVHDMVKAVLDRWGHVDILVVNGDRNPPIFRGARKPGTQRACSAHAHFFLVDDILFVQSDNV